MGNKISVAGGPSYMDDEPGAHPARVEGEARVRPGEEGTRFAALNVGEPAELGERLTRPLDTGPKAEWVAFALAVNAELDPDQPEPLPGEQVRASSTTRGTLIEAYGGYGIDDDDGDGDGGE